MISIEDFNEYYQKELPRLRRKLKRLKGEEKEALQKQINQMQKAYDNLPNSFIQ